MKTDSKSTEHQRKGGPGGSFRSKKKTGSFFRAVPESDQKSQKPHRPGGGTGAGPAAWKRGPGMQKTTSFKPKQHQKGQGQRHDGSKQGSNHHPKGAQKGHPKDQKRSPPAKGKTGAAQLFVHGKPEKVNYCLAPERLEAQARAIRELEREKKEKQLEGRKQERNRQHKMMTQKTRKGQPVMQGRLEMLLEKVKKTVGVQ